MVGIVSVWDIVHGLRSRIENAPMSHVAKVAPEYAQESLRSLVRDETPLPRNVSLAKV